MTFYYTCALLWVGITKDGGSVSIQKTIITKNNTIPPYKI